ncbi:MAG: TIGR02921 family PEP-CTERM protein [Scytonematopsis contorta HA4267-MV1]|jgi:putative PEP-CTERM system integral membrane protein|nr:TIGR02921 family PEP-CTERM protein [Scytonematopsis contorta HA4267-MV1]
MTKLLKTTLQAIFWIWNLVFLVVVYFGILPVVGLPLIQATFRGDVPIDFFLSLVGLIAVPTICTILGAWKLRNNPLDEFRLFYGIEAPLFLLCLLRLFLFREMTPASTHILTSVGICIFAFAAELFYGYAERRRSVTWLQMLAHTLMLFVGVYAGIIMLFYAIPVAAWLVKEFFQFYWLKGLWYLFTHDPIGTVLWWTPWTIVLFILTSSLFVVMPSMVAALYTSSGWRIIRKFFEQYGQKRTLAGTLGIAITSLTLFFSFQQQPQVQAFSLLERPIQTDNARKELLANSETIRSGLVNAYLHNYRYLSSVQENNHIKVMYKGIFGLPESLAQGLQDTYNRLMSPFLYKGSAFDADKAEKLYAQFFDKSIQKGEQPSINHALESTSNLDEAKAGLLNLNQKKVWLRKQEVTVKENGDSADVQLYEVYENKTRDVQEVFYSFSLPESSVITGIWLGDTADLSKRFEFVVSPRGAAQKVYNRQVQRARPIDPALLEQVGPRHYRLRAFPIPVINSGFANAVGTQPNTQPNRPTEMHMWLTYKVMQQEKGWALPQLGEKRNIFWTDETKRIRNGKPSNERLDDWVEAYIPANKPYQPALHQVKLTDEYTITAKPLTEKDYSLPKNQRFAIVLDSSLSMNSHIKDLNKTFDWLKKQGFANNSLTDNDADLYITSTKGSEPKRLDDVNQFNPGKIIFYGSVQLKDMLQQFDKLRGDTVYNGILLVTDEGSYELSNDKKNIPALSAPLWMVHLGAFPPAYDDTTLKAIENSGGGVSAELSEVFKRLATKSALGENAVSVVDNYAWLMEKTQVTPPSSPPKSPLPTPHSLEPLAARQLVLGLSREKNLDKLTELDAIHALAKKYKIVTPYSSMIVLVNDEQRRQLKEAEADKDRFDRKVESGKENLTKPFNPLNTVSVPEPSNAVALGVVGIIFLVFAKKGRFKKAG